MATNVGNSYPGCIASVEKFIKNTGDNEAAYAYPELLSKQGIFCSNEKIGEWLEQYYSAANVSQKSLLDKIISICKSEKSDGKACAEDLISVASKIDLFEEKCKKDGLAEGKNGDLCIRLESSKAVITAYEGNLFEDVCSHEEGKSISNKIDALTCENNIIEALKTKYAGSEIDLCDKPTLQENDPRRACYMLFLKKTLFEKNSSDCLAKVKSTKTFDSCKDATKSPEELRLIEDIKQKYCQDENADMNATSKAAQDKCVKDMINFFASYFAGMEPNDALAKCAKSFAGNEDQIKSCQKEAFYNYIKNQNNLSLFNCFDNSKYKKFEEQKACYKESQDIQAQIDKCKKNPVPHPDERTCLSSIYDSASAIGKQMISNHLNNVATSSHMHCDGQTPVKEKLLCNNFPHDPKYNPSASGSGDISLNGTTLTNNSSDPTKNIFAGAAGAGMATGMLATALNNSGSNTNTPNDPLNLKGKYSSLEDCMKGESKLDFKPTTSVGIEESNHSKTICEGQFGEGNLGAGGRGNQNGKKVSETTNVKNAEQVTQGKNGFLGLYKDLNYLKVRPDPNQPESKAPCEALRNAAKIRIAGKVLGTATLIVTGIVAKNKFDEQKKAKSEGTNPVDSYLWQKSVLVGGGAALGIYLVSNMQAEKKLLAAEVQSATIAASNAGDPINCKMGKDKGNKSASSFDPFLYKNKNKLHAKTETDIQNSRNYTELETLNSEMDRFLDGEISSITVADYNKRLNDINNLYIDQDDFSAIKKSFALVSKYTPNLFFGDAFAAKEESGILGQTMKNLLPMFLTAAIMSSFNGNNNRDRIGAMSGNGQNNNSSGNSDNKKEDNTTSQNSASTQETNVPTPEEEKKVSGQVKTSTEQVEGLVPKVDALTLLVDYQQVIGVDKEEKLVEIKKNAQNVKVVDGLMNQVSTNPK